MNPAAPYPHRKPDPSIHSPEKQLYLQLAEVMKNNTDVLISRLNSETFPQWTLDNLLFKAFAVKNHTAFAAMLKTSSYTPGVLSNIIVDKIKSELTDSKLYLRELLENRSDIKQQLLDSALHIAAGKGSELKDAALKVINRLIQSGADITSLDEKNYQTALEIATACNNPCAEVIQYLSDLKEANSKP